MTPTLYLIWAALAAAAFIAFQMMGVNSSFNWNACYPLGALYIALFADAGADLILLLVSLFHGKPGRLARFVVSGILAAALLVYGTVNMQIVRPRELTYTSGKIREEHRFVFLADL